MSIHDVRISPIVSISEDVRTEKDVFRNRTGNNFIAFQRGELNFDTPRYISDSISVALDKGLTKYPKSGGESFLKQAILTRLKNDYKIYDLSEDNIICTYGAQEGLNLAFSLFKSGLGISPIWSCILENFVLFNDIYFEQLPLNADFSIDFDLFEASIAEVDFLYLNNPHNPTGKVYTLEELKQIYDICMRNGVFIISDEAYDQILYDGSKHHTMAAFDSENIITVFSLSKTYAMTGWRLGYVVCRNKTIAKKLRLGDYTCTAGVSTPLQYAASVALSEIELGYKHIRKMVAELETRRNLFYDGLKTLNNVHVYGKPKGAFYFFPTFTDAIPRSLVGIDRERYIYASLMNVGISCVYGSCFGKYFTDYVRFSFSSINCSEIEEAISRMAKIFS